MSLDKAIEHGKEKRKPYRRSKRWDLSCRNHGGCTRCYSNRMHSTKVRIAIAEDTKLEMEYGEV